VFLRRVIAIALVLEAVLLIAVDWFLWNLNGDLFVDHPLREGQGLLPMLAILGYVTLLPPVIVYAWRGALPSSLLPRCLVLATTLAVTATQLVLPFAIDGGLNDSTILWGFCVALGLAYMLNRDVLRPAPVTTEQ
jgi:hypothetical protein